MCEIPAIYIACNSTKGATEMVSESRRRLNQRLRQNWIEQNRKFEAPGRSATPLSGFLVGASSESDLTSLSWLIDLNMDFLAQPLHPTSKTGLDRQHPSFASGLLQPEDGGDHRERCRKPTHTYSAMITMAINETPERQITVAGIYNWIRNNFAYYRETSASWKNSVRHCLSTNRRFHRVPQTRDKFGKRFWRIVPELRPGTSGGASVPRAPHRPIARFPRTTTTTLSDDCNISEAIRCIGRWETIDSTGESQGSSDSTDESSSGDSLSAAESPQPPSSDPFSPDWSCDTRLNEILRDLSDLESNEEGFESAPSFEPKSHCPDRQRLTTNFDNDSFLTNLNSLNSSAEDWNLTDLTQLSSCKPISEFLPISCIDDLSSYLLLDTDLGFRTMI